MHLVHGAGLIPGWGTKIPHAVGHSKKKKKTQVRSCRSLLRSTAYPGLPTCPLPPRPHPSPSARAQSGTQCVLELFIE